MPPFETEFVKIDRSIANVQSQLRAREGFDGLSAESWQTAWDRHPGLKARARDLFLRRGEMQRGRR